MAKRKPIGRKNFKQLSKTALKKLGLTKRAERFEDRQTGEILTRSEAERRAQRYRNESRLYKKHNRLPVGDVRVSSKIQNEKSIYNGMQSITIYAKSKEDLYKKIDQLRRNGINIKSISMVYRYDPISTKYKEAERPPYYGVNKVQPDNYQKTLDYQIQKGVDNEGIIPKTGHARDWGAKIYTTTSITPTGKNS